MNDQILREFLTETEDLLEILFGDLQALRVRHNEGRARRELVGRIFRHVHTIKGSSATVELNAMARIAHEFETLLDGVRLGRVPVDEMVLDAFDDAANALAQSLERAAHGESQPQAQALVERLRKLSLPEHEEKKSPAVRRALARLPEAIARSLSEHEAHRLHESVEEGARLFIVAVNFELATFDERFRSLSDTLSEEGEIISTLPGLETASPDQIGFRIVYAAKASRAELVARISAFGQAALTELSDMRTDETGNDQREAEAAALAESPLPRTIAPLWTRVRVELQELDEIINTTHEVLGEATGAFNLAASVNQEDAGRAELRERVGNVRRRLVELEERLINLRMIPVAQMLERAERAGRIAARLTGKQVDFEIQGSHVRIDKSLADAMADPLLHILRNAVDHGIETPMERTAAGKNERGRVRLGAWAEGSRVILRVEDDGRGIDPLRVTRVAAGQGIIEAGKLLTKEQAMRLIFRPGFSTASIVSNVSGRGVGLDVVERAIELVGGELRVSSEQGAGTIFEMVLPTTLALTPALVVHSAGHRYCIDEKYIAETGFVTQSEIERSGEAERVRWRGQLAPLIRMRHLLGQPPREDTNGDSVPVIILPVGGETATGGVRDEVLAVDAFGERAEALVRGLGRHAARWRGISGATKLPDGTVALVLDLPRLLEMNQSDNP
ncbi:MAG: two-component system, chemotaxis family, sensor kinase CheA [Acidobacteriota bacterium]|jgi:two-component system chemotaxis sensor kinase CheA|nr:two-component system, chemotaxis family, sensor kinase CheA [Acidobacteriota bacterium]